MQTTIQKLNQRHYKILELCLRGWTNQQIAENLSMSGQQISIVVKSPSFQHELAVRRSKLDDMVDEQITDGDDEITRVLKEGAKHAVERLVGHIDHMDGNVSLRASNDVLDRAGYPKVQRVETRGVSVVIGAEDAKLIDETMRMDKDE